MNADRRKQITTVKTQLEAIRDEEQNAYDNMPESLQEGDKGEAATASIEYLEEAISALENIE